MEKEIILTTKQLFEVLEDLPDGVMLVVSWGIVMENQNEIKVVSIRLVEEPPLYSSHALQTVEDVLDTVGEELRKYDRELFCILNVRSKNQVINMNIVSMGTLSTAVVHQKPCR